MCLDVVKKCGDDNLAFVYVARLRRNGRLIEMVESRQPPRTIREKWVLIISTLMGCPVACPMCDAGGSYHGRLTAEEMMAQVEYLVRSRFGDLKVPSGQFKIQFARMGEPALNGAVLDVLESLPRFLEAPGLMPSISTVAPARSGAFFSRLLDIKRELYRDGRFQLQFSLHSTDREARDRIIPIGKWTLEQIADFSERFHEPEDRRITLNFVACRDYPVDPLRLVELFDPDRFLIKVTPLNPTFNARRHGLHSGLGRDEDRSEPEWLEPLRRAGFPVLLSIGEWEENRIGSNCGQYAQSVLETREELNGAYQYRMRPAGEPPAAPGE